MKSTAKDPGITACVMFSRHSCATLIYFLVFSIITAWERKKGSKHTIVWSWTIYAIHSVHNYPAESTWEISENISILDKCCPQLYLLTIILRCLAQWPNQTCGFLLLHIVVHLNCGRWHNMMRNSSVSAPPLSISNECNWRVKPHPKTSEAEMSEIVARRGEITDSSPAIMNWGLSAVLVPSKSSTAISLLPINTICWLATERWTKGPIIHSIFSICPV